MSNTWDLRPHVGFGPLRIGMTREEAIDALGAPDAEQDDDDAPVLTWHDPPVSVVLGPRVERIVLDAGGPEVRYQGLKMMSQLADEVVMSLRRRGNRERRSVEDGIVTHRFPRLDLELRRDQEGHRFERVVVGRLRSRTALT